MRFLTGLAVIFFAASPAARLLNSAQSFNPAQSLDIVVRPDAVHVEALEGEIVPVKRVFFHVVFHNLAPGPIELQWVRFDLVGRNGEIVSGQFSGTALTDLFGDSIERRRIEPTPGDTLLLGPDQRKAISDVFFEAPARMVGETLVVEGAFLRDGNVVVSSVTVPLTPRKDSVVRLPFDGIWYVAAGHGSLDTHRRFTSEAFAYDFLRIGEEGRSHGGQGTLNSDYYAYGQPVLAAADGEVTYVRNDVPENAPGEAMPATPGGNAVIIRHADDFYTYYAHMRPGGMRVGIGDIVVKGDVIGEVGNSGDSTEPHLHFHAMSGPDAAASGGIPVVFESWVSQAYGSKARVRGMDTLPRGDFVSAP